MENEAEMYRFILEQMQKVNDNISGLKVDVASRFSKIETKIDGYNSLREKLDCASSLSQANKRDIENLKLQQQADISNLKNDIDTHRKEARERKKESRATIYTVVTGFVLMVAKWLFFDNK